MTQNQEETKTNDAEQTPKVEETPAATADVTLDAKDDTEDATDGVDAKDGNAKDGNAKDGEDADVAEASTTEAIVTEEHVEHVEIVEFSHPGDDKKFTHTFDGIEEYDNPMPRWWVNLFWLSIVFSVFYFGYYHMSGRSSDRYQDYDNALVQWKIKRIKVLSAFAKLPLTLQFKRAMADKRNIEKGRKIFLGKGICATCHGADGGGLIGPNLTDDYWINGPKKHRVTGPNLRDIFRVVTYGGRKGKQMQAYRDLLSPMERVQVALFVASLRGKKTKKPKPKLPEAKKYRYVMSPIVP